jgi:hypothetical protein
MPSLDPEQVTIISLLLFIGIAGFKRYWVWGYQLAEAQLATEEAKEEADEWKGIALEQWRTTGKAVAVAETVVKEQA